MIRINMLRSIIFFISLFLSVHLTELAHRPPEIWQPSDAGVRRRTPWRRRPPPKTASRVDAAAAPLLYWKKMRTPMSVGMRGDYSDSFFLKRSSPDRLRDGERERERECPGTVWENLESLKCPMGLQI